MRVLLPPSESKRPGGGSSTLKVESLAYNAALGEMRNRVMRSLTELSRDPERAMSALKVGVKSRAEIEHNLVLHESGTRPAITRYSGVLYDAIEAHELRPEVRSWIDENVLIQSALFGLIGAGDEIPHYRLSASSTFPAFGRPRHAAWRDAHALIEWESMGFILDLRSKDYVALAPVPGNLPSTYLNVVQDTGDGRRRALNHFNKQAKGELVRLLADSRADIETVDDLLDWARDQGLQIEHDVDAEATFLVTDVGAPAAV